MTTGTQEDKAQQLTEPQQQCAEVSEPAAAQAETPQSHVVPHHRPQDLRRLHAAARQHTEDRHRPHLRQALRAQEVILLQVAATTEAVHLQAAATTEAAADTAEAVLIREAADTAGAVLHQEAADTAEAALHQEVTDVN
jgi:hypothetical protein